jgi:hypothetical protein
VERVDAAVAGGGVHASAGAASTSAMEIRFLVILPPFSPQRATLEPIRPLGDE